MLQRLPDGVLDSVGKLDPFGPDAREPPGSARTLAGLSGRFEYRRRQELGVALRAALAGHWARGGEVALETGRGVHSMRKSPMVIVAVLACSLVLAAGLAGAATVSAPIADGFAGPLYVSLLPGGPEDPSLGARGAVYRVDPQTGVGQKLAGGFAGATNLAVGGDGTIYVSELFADEIAVVRGGTTVDTIPLSQPGAVEYADGVLYASTDVFGNGAVVTITP